MSDITVITESVRKEATKWRRLADQVEPIRGAVQSATLGATAFFIGDGNAAAHHQAYYQYQAFMEDILRGAVVEFEQLGKALNKVADAYDDAERVIELDLDKIYGV
jgi:uncharacterized protein YukE